MPQGLKNIDFAMDLIARLNAGVDQSAEFDPYRLLLSDGEVVASVGETSIQYTVGSSAGQVNRVWGGSFYLKVGATAFQDIKMNDDNLKSPGGEAINFDRVMGILLHVKDAEIANPTDPDGTSPAVSIYSSGVTDAWTGCGWGSGNVANLGSGGILAMRSGPFGWAVTSSNHAFRVALSGSSGDNVVVSVMILGRMD
jgi:hypothetical protein